MSSGPWSPRRHDGSDFFLEFKHAKLWFGVRSNELHSYMLVFLADDYQIGKVALDRLDSFVLDVGANIGMFSVAAAKRFPRATICAFEPHPSAYRRLVRNVEANGATNIHPINLAAWSSSGVFGFSNCLATTSAHISEDGGLAAKTVTLDDFCTGSAIHHVGGLKVDVEGAEVEVLKGAAKTLKATEWVLVECHSQALADEVDAVLRDRGFSKVSETRMPDGSGVLRFQNSDFRSLR